MDAPRHQGNLRRVHRHLRALQHPLSHVQNPFGPRPGPRIRLIPVRAIRRHPRQGHLRAHPPKLLPRPHPAAAAVQPKGPNV